MYKSNIKIAIPNSCQDLNWTKIKTIHLGTFK